MLYFAYGSNLDPRQMRRRCPSSRFVCPARLDDYRLAFSLRSRKRRCGVANVLAEPGAAVWGAVYRINHPRDIEVLDAAEGFRPGRKRGNRYQRNVVRVQPLLQPGAAATNLLSTAIYIAQPEKAPPPPSAAYLGQMIFGADHWRLPGDYRAYLRTIGKS